MSRQGFLFRALNLLGSNRVIFSNRILNNLNFPIPPSLVMGIKHVARDNLKALNIPERPKKPLGPYIRFVTEHREKVLKENPKFSAKEVVLKCAEIWRNLSHEEKEKYSKGYGDQLEEYRVQWIKFDEKLTPEQREALKKASDEKAKDREHRRIKKLSKDTNKPKRPVSPFVRYVWDQSKILNKSLKDTMTEFKGKYPDLPLTVREKYEAQFAQEKAQYEKDLENWKEKVVKEGLGNRLKIKEDAPEKTKKTSSTTKQGQSRGNQ